MLWNYFTQLTDRGTVVSYGFSPRRARVLLHRVRTCTGEKIQSYCLYTGKLHSAYPLVIKEIILADLPEDLPGGYRPGFLKIKTGSRLGTVHTSEHRSLE